MTKRSQNCFVTRACSLFVVVALIDAQPARAQEEIGDCRTADTAKPNASCVVVKHEGRKGVWFQLTTADSLRRSHLLVEELQVQLKDYSRLDASRTAEVEALRGALTAQKAATAKAKEAAELSAQEARAAEESALAAQRSLDKWWRTPWVWLSIGALSGALAAIALTH